jgi:hypothetical protein
MMMVSANPLLQLGIGSREALVVVNKSRTKGQYEGQIQAFRGTGYLSR